MLHKRNVVDTSIPETTLKQKPTKFTIRELDNDALARVLTMIQEGKIEQLREECRRIRGGPA